MEQGGAEDKSWFLGFGLFPKGQTRHEVLFHGGKQEREALGDLGRHHNWSCRFLDAGENGVAKKR